MPRPQPAALCLAFLLAAPFAARADEPPAPAAAGSTEEARACAERNLPAVARRNRFARHGHHLGDALKRDGGGPVHPGQERTARIGYADLDPEMAIACVHFRRDGGQPPFEHLAGPRLNGHARGHVHLKPAGFELDLPPPLIVTVGLILQMLLMKPAGFVIATAVLFVAVAYALGSRRILLNAAVGLLLCAITYVAFTRGLGLVLPAGVLGTLFG